VGVEWSDGILTALGQPRKKKSPRNRSSSTSRGAEPLTSLAAARARGVILGGMREKSLELQAEAEARAEELRSVFVELVGLSHRAAARTLNERGVKTATGKPWSPVTVTRVRQRLGLI